ncbi:helix-turn-helix domain-containing protein [Streptomyces fulvoviolaceus]|uniref:helix-turn-helix domain-containing protein n=1 Tax=Streptomyces fulvoviolaceus TaxID=285535 RepID=UPI0021C1CF2E|nr:helix-turn-helix transcriptional regulator [Streptomyces fulvoviolaceus]MCT9079563.1 helix-turn-helix domain-containing protein [Streptomyces fulvoviolaceus]
MSAPQPPQDDVQEFAALLRRLKDRTDRSYGSLARRLNMNTSTLHRYCAGDAVPVDFAPVERFAALCGASAEERLELHRLWLLAVAARQRPRAAESAEAPEEPVAEGAPDRPWYRRRRIAVTAAVTAALLATLGSLSALPSGGPPADDAAPAPLQSSGTTTSGTPHRSSSTSPSASSSATRSPSAKGTSTKPSAPASGSRGPSSGSGGSDGPATAADPFTWTVNSHVWNAGCGHDYVIDKPPTQVPPPPAAQDAAPWAAAQGALHGRDTYVQISVQGRNSTAVVLEALRVRVVGRAAPFQGNSYAMDNGCGGALTPRVFSVDLDADRPVAHSEAGFDGENAIPAIQMPYRVSVEDPEVLLVTARTETCDCSWYLELDWSAQGRTGTARIDNAGDPFRTTSIKGLTRYSYDTSGRQWVTDN